MDQSPLISVIICTRNRRNLIGGSVQSLLEQEPGSPPFEILVVDNGSQDDTVQVVQDIQSHHPEKVRLIEEPIAGLSQARNRGVREARAAVIAFLDDDARAAPGWVAAMAGAFRDHRVGEAGGPIELGWRCQRPDWWEDQLDYLTQGRSNRGERSFEMEYPILPTGMNMAFSRKALVEAGLFRTNLGRNQQSMMAGEEIDLALRIKAKGFRIVYQPDAKVVHLVSAGRTTLNYLHRRAYWHGRSQVLVEFLGGKGIQKSPLLLPLLLLKGLAGHLTKHRMSRTSQFYLIFNFGYLVQAIAIIFGRFSLEPPPRLD